MLSEQAERGLEGKANEVELLLATGRTPEDAFKIVGIEGLDDATFFLAYLQEYRPELYKKIK